MRLTDDFLLAHTDRLRVETSGLIERYGRITLGQVLTPPPVANFMASMFDLSSTGEAKLLDPGAGVGSLSSAFADRWKRERGDDQLTVTAVEVDPMMREGLTQALENFAHVGVSTRIVSQDFVEWSVDQVAGFGALSQDYFDFVILNPPYAKIRRDSRHRRLIEQVGVEVPNIYAGFLALAARMLDVGGQLVAIIPRSFANGPYFRSFRTDFLGLMMLRRVHVYDSRDTAFADAKVLQENVVIHAVKGGEPSTVTVSSSSSSTDFAHVVREVDYEEVVHPEDRERFVRLTADQLGKGIVQRMGRLPSSLSGLGLEVSTGRVVDFRTKQNLRQDHEPGSVALIYPTHLRQGALSWPIEGSKKPNALALNDETRSLVLPHGTYVVLKRFTSKEQARRVTAFVVDTNRLPGEWVAFENHLNVIHQADRPLDEYQAMGLAAFLNSTLLDLYFRQLSGHTQVNATDLRSMRFPGRDDLTRLGESIGKRGWSQDSVDALLIECILELAPDGEPDPVAAHKHVKMAQQVLRDLGLPPAQQNERSALTLLALLKLTPDKAWSDVEAPLMGITPLMDFMAEFYGKQYAPNSRETIRRQTVHQFVEAGIAQLNPDDPQRPVNSGKTVYQVPAELIVVLQTLGKELWEDSLAEWREAVPALAERWAREREMNLIPVRMPDGTEVNLTSGGQNPLIQAIVQDFCPRFAAGAEVLYLGEAGEKWVLNATNAFGELGLSIDEHGKMPDVVVLDRERNWLLLIEAVTTHGPVDAKRHGELQAMFGASSAPLVYVTAFADRASFARYSSDIGWETEVWIAEAPTHMIHYNGERFLGPYES